MVEKIRNTVLIGIATTFIPVILQLFFYIVWQQRTGIYLMGVAGMVWLWTQEEKPDVIQQVFEAKGIQVNGEYPVPVESKNEEADI